MLFLQSKMFAFLWNWVQRALGIQEGLGISRQQLSEAERWQERMVGPPLTDCLSCWEPQTISAGPSRLGSDCSHRRGLCGGGTTLSGLQRWNHLPSCSREELGMGKVPQRPDCPTAKEIILRYC